MLNEMKAFYRIFFPRQNDEGKLTARVPDVNETRLNENFKIILDEFRKVWNVIKNSGLLDATSMRSSATLSEPGWYRIASCALSGSAIDVAVGSAGRQIVDSEVLLSSSNTAQIVIKNLQVSNYVSDLRVMLGGGFFHIDMKKADNTSMNISVDLTPRGNARATGNLTAASLTPISNSPPGETELASISTVKRTAPLSSPTSLITSGTIEDNATFSYTAPQPCWVYYVPVLQGDYFGGFEIRLNGVVLASYSSGEPLDVNVAAIPVPMQRGDVLYISQNTNRTSTYRVLTMRGAS